MIPKKFHYCWFGGKELPEEFNAYIKEWKALHPDFEVIRWDESNSPMDLAYMQKASEMGLTSRMSNLIRLYTMIKHGGIYLDTDMKLIKPLYDLLNCRCFLGFQSGKVDTSDFSVNNAIIGAEANHPFMKRCYDKLLDLFEQDEQKTMGLLSPDHTTEILKKAYGLKHYGDQTLKEGVQLYSTQYFYPIPYERSKLTREFSKHIEDCTYAVHMWSRTWYSKEKMLEIIDGYQEDFYWKNLQIKSLEQKLDKLIESTSIVRFVKEKLKQKLKKMKNKDKP